MCQLGIARLTRIGCSIVLIEWPFILIKPAYEMIPLFFLSTAKNADFSPMARKLLSSITRQSIYDFVYIRVETGVFLTTPEGG